MMDSPFGTTDESIAEVGAHAWRTRTATEVAWKGIHRTELYFLLSFFACIADALLASRFFCDLCTLVSP